MFNHKRRTPLASILALSGLAGCQTPRHTDMLVFGTNTQFGVAVSSDATSTPGVNIGYKRQEVVLMPLYVNGQQSQFAPKEPSSPTAPDNLKYIGTDGTSPAKTDTYSVLASFGASGKGQTTGTAEIGIAQYFATGLAARTLAYAGGALINTGDHAADASRDTAKAAAAAALKIGDNADARLANLSLLSQIDSSLQALKSDPEAQAHASQLDKIDRSADAVAFTLYFQPGANANVISTRALPALPKPHNFGMLVEYHAWLNTSVMELKSQFDPLNPNLQVQDAAGTVANPTLAFATQATVDLAKQKEILATLDKKLGQDPALVAAVQYFSRQLLTSNAESK